MARILHTASNNSGIPLEELLVIMIDELSTELNDLSSGNHTDPGILDHKRRVNMEIRTLLCKALTLESSTLAYAIKYSNLKPYKLDGVDIEATPMSHSDYAYAHDDAANYGADFSEDGYLIIAERGTPRHKEWWLPTKCFDEYTE